MASNTKSPLKPVLAKIADTKPSTTVGVSKPVTKPIKSTAALNVKKTPSSTNDTEIQKKTPTVSKSTLSNKASPTKVVKTATVSPTKSISTKPPVATVAVRAAKTPVAPLVSKETPKSSFKDKAIDSQKLASLKVNLSSKFSNNENVKSSPKSPIVKVASTSVSKTNVIKTDISKAVTKPTVSSGQLTTPSKEITGKPVKPMKDSSKLSTPNKANTAKPETAKLVKNDTAVKKTVQRTPSANLNNNLKNTKILTKSLDSKITKSQNDMKTKNNKENIKMKSAGKDVSTKTKKGDLIIIKCNFDEKIEDEYQSKNNIKLEGQDLSKIFSEEKIDQKSKEENPMVHETDSEFKNMKETFQENLKITLEENTISDEQEFSNSKSKEVSVSDEVTIDNEIKDESLSTIISENSLQSSTISSSYYQDYVNDIEPVSYTMAGQVVFGYDETDESLDELSTINEENEICSQIENNQEAHGDDVDVGTHTSCSGESCDSEQFEIVDSTFEVEKEQIILKEKKNDEFVMIEIESSNKQIDKELMMDQKYIYFVKEELSNGQQNSNEDQTDGAKSHIENKIFVTAPEKKNLIHFDDDSTTITSKNELCNKDENILLSNNKISNNDDDGVPAENNITTENNFLDNSVELTENNFFGFDGQTEKIFPINSDEGKIQKNDFLEKSENNFPLNCGEIKIQKNDFFERSENNFPLNCDESEIQKNDLFERSENKLPLNGDEGKISKVDFFERSENNFSIKSDEGKIPKIDLLERSENNFPLNSDEGKTCTKIDLFKPPEINILSNVHENIEAFESNLNFHEINLNISSNFQENNFFNNHEEIQDYSENYSQEITVKKIFLMNVESISKYIQYNNQKCTRVITYNDLLSNVGQPPTYAEILMRNNQKSTYLNVIPKYEKKSGIFFKCNKQNCYKNLSINKLMLKNDIEENLIENNLIKEDEENSEENFKVICRKKPRKNVIKSENIEEIISEDSSSEEDTDFIQDIPHIMKCKKQKKMKIQFNKKNIMKRLNNKGMKNEEIFILPVWKNFKGI